jgi:hypothetical protein
MILGVHEMRPAEQMDEIFSYAALPSVDKIGGGTAVGICYTERIWDGRAVQGLGWMDPYVVRGAVRG